MWPRIEFTKPILAVSDLERVLEDGKAPKAVRTAAEAQMEEFFADAPRFSSYGQVDMALGTERIDFHTLVWFFFPPKDHISLKESGKSGRWIRTTAARGARWATSSTRASGSGRKSSTGARAS